jgi:hypothetical protein
LVVARLARVVVDGTGTRRAVRSTRAHRITIVVDDSIVRGMRIVGVWGVGVRIHFEMHFFARKTGTKGTWRDVVARGCGDGCPYYCAGRGDERSNGMRVVCLTHTIA